MGMEIGALLDANAPVIVSHWAEADKVDKDNLSELERETTNSVEKAIQSIYHDPDDSFSL